MTSTAAPAPDLRRARRWPVHPAWLVAAVAFVALLGAAGFRAAPGVLVTPLEAEFGWSRSVVSTAVAVNLVLFGLMAPFAAALMDRFGIRRVTVVALLLVAAGSGGAVAVTAAWQIVALWGVLVGVGTGSMALVFAATVAQRWFVTRRGLVTGVLTAASATGQLVLLPVTAQVAASQGWRTASLVVSLAALAVVPLVWALLRDRPEDLGTTAYGAPAPPPPSPPPPAPHADHPPSAPRPTSRGAASTAVRALADASGSRAFWALVVGFAICGATTNGLVGTHFVPAAHDHGMAVTTAAGLLAVVGVFDVVGTVASGWLTDRVDPRWLLAGYYAFRGAALLALPSLLGEEVRPSVVLFVVVYGLDWVATVPPTVALCRDLFGERGTVVFGWVFASHQLGAALAAAAAGAVRDATGEYTAAWLGAGALCVVAAALSGRVRRSAPGAAR